MKKITILNIFYILGVAIIFIINLPMIKYNLFGWIIVSLTITFLIFYPLIRKTLLKNDLKGRKHEAKDVYQIYDALLTLEKQCKKREKELRNNERQLKQSKKEFEEQKKHTQETEKFIEEELTKISNDMPGESYERFVGFCLMRRGWKIIKYTKRSRDYGADIIARTPSGLKTSIQCKRYKKNVGIDAVQQVYASERYYNCNRGVVITNSKFTPSARELAKKQMLFYTKIFLKKKYILLI